MLRFTFNGTAILFQCDIQWQPARGRHDPNPPIILEDDRPTDAQFDDFSALDEALDDGAATVAGADAVVVEGQPPPLTDGEFEAPSDAEDFSVEPPIDGLAVEDQPANFGELAPDDEPPGDEFMVMATADGDAPMAMPEELAFGDDGEFAGEERSSPFPDDEIAPAVAADDVDGVAPDLESDAIGGVTDEALVEDQPLVAFDEIGETDQLGDDVLAFAGETPPVLDQLFAAFDDVDTADDGGDDIAAAAEAPVFDDLAGAWLDEVSGLDDLVDDIALSGPVAEDLPAVSFDDMSADAEPELSGYDLLLAALDEVVLFEASAGSLFDDEFAPADDVALELAFPGVGADFVPNTPPPAVLPRAGGAVTMFGAADGPSSGRAGAATAAPRGAGSGASARPGKSAALDRPPASPAAPR